MWRNEYLLTACSDLTGLAEFSPEIGNRLRGDRLEYLCNTQVVYTLRDVRVRLGVLWDYEARPGGGDTHNAVYRTGHEADFAAVVAEFLNYVETPHALPTWEQPHLLTKSFVTTQGRCGATDDVQCLRAWIA